ncbi:capsid portal protein [Rhizobium phage RHph_X2_26]|nr:capsid portal protein [Rhizobium phage RHph_X2_26]
MAKKKGAFAGLRKFWGSTVGRVTGMQGRFLTGLIREPYAGAWQQNMERSQETVLSYAPVFACASLIASDIAKLPLRPIGLVNGVWLQIADKDLDALLVKPNAYQNKIQFLENWILSKLFTGNTFILKGRGDDNKVVSLKVLDPNLVQVKVSTSGEIFYELNADNVNGIEEPINVPASEIIHDRFNCLFHPLMGISPLYACALAANQGLSIQEAATTFFQNGSQMSGILTSPDTIDDETAARLKAHWEENYSGPKGAGKVAVAGDGLKFESRSMTSADSQLIEQLGWTAETICSVFHVPAFKIGVGEMPPYNNIQALNQQYYSQCLQILIESVETGLDIGLGLDAQTGVELDVKALLRMDSLTQMEVAAKGVISGLLKPDEGRADMGYSPVKGGDTPYLQEQNYSLAALARRDAMEDLWAGKVPVKTPPAPTPSPAPEKPPEKKLTADEAAEMVAKAFEKARK